MSVCRLQAEKNLVELINRHRIVTAYGCRLGLQALGRQTGLWEARKP